MIVWKEQGGGRNRRGEVEGGRDERRAGAFNIKRAIKRKLQTN